jgi:hypothetical protein
MITAFIAGGLGNQMFRYAMGRAVAKKLGVGLQLNISGFDTYTLHRYGLDQWRGVTEPITTYADNMVEEIGLPYTSGLKVFDGCTLGNWDIGNWQCEKYFIDIRQELLRTFQPKALSEQAQWHLRQIREVGEKSIFIHVRRNDYVGCGILGVNLEDYYARAVNLMRNTVDHSQYFMFTDDPKWVRDNFKHCKFTLISGNGTTNCEEMWMMSKCYHAIIPNSTFSWWGAWLHDKPRALRPSRFSRTRKTSVERIVTAPITWFLNKYDSRDIIPNGWIKL